MCISWSYLYRGKAALVKIKKTTPKTILSESQKLPGKKKISSNGNHPPKNRIEEKTLIKSMLAYSPKKNNAKVIAEYSTL